MRPHLVNLEGRIAVRLLRVRPGDTIPAFELECSLHP